ncbi:hypothetical protein [Devosia lacusdianchii]|uniref:hypothetical protein n=1 Tax=Devosia lacusdianchii TaxID=2917991 RepID=UPI001F051A8E|nr:hypothetical protein [Devosia sp. JXJ CY 41]
MASIQKFPLRIFVLFTAIPALLIGGGLWYLSSLLPSCATAQHARITSPDNQFDLVVFSRDCGATTGFNTQAALIPSGEDLPYDAASFLSIGVAADLEPRWDGFGNIEVTVPPGAQIYRQDESVAGVSVIYR